MTQLTDAAMETQPGPGALDILDKVNLSAGHTAVCGLQWGDEGKGQIVDMLTGVYDLVVRYNGGNNAGHSVKVGNEKFALHLIPSGILNPKAINVVGNGVVVDPAGILKEIDALRKRNVAVGDNLRISDRAHVVLPYHKVQDTLYDSAVSAAQGTKPIGTTGRGIGPCYADKALRCTAIRMGDFLNLDDLKAKLGRIVAIKNATLQGLADMCNQPFEPLDAKSLFADCKQHAQLLAPHICDTTALIQNAVKSNQKVLFEGANAAMLDIDHGTYPFVTSSSCSSLGVYPGSGMPGGTLTNVIGIAKLYTSRVGGGPFPTEQDNQTGNNLRQKGGEFGTTTGRPRRCGWFDLVAVKYAAQISGVTALACTGLAVLSGLKELQVCVGYRYQGQDLGQFPASCDVLGNLEPVFETLPGFDQPVDSCTRWDQLPRQAQDYVQFIEDQLNVPIVMVCVGQGRHQIIVKNES